VSSKAEIGKGCNLGQNVFVGEGVLIGNNVKIQNNVSIYTGTVIEDDVFLGPSCVLTNISNPRSQVKRNNLYENTIIKKGATIGANATIVCGSTIGRYAFVSAGATITGDVSDYALMMGIPARQNGWMSRHGHKLINPDVNQIMICSESGFKYKLSEGVLRCIDLNEETELPEGMRVGKFKYRKA
jgi:UDP-2-acetamido-3-amino-2,3-dideoxy-glucuronate N-acetyltransferase